MIQNIANFLNENNVKYTLSENSFYLNKKYSNYSVATDIINKFDITIALDNNDNSFTVSTEKPKIAVYKSTSLSQLSFHGRVEGVMNCLDINFKLAKKKDDFVAFKVEGDINKVIDVLGEYRESDKFGPVLDTIDYFIDKNKLCFYAVG